MVAMKFTPVRIELKPRIKAPKTAATVPLVARTVE
jgi:hypothetical protein